MQLNIIKITVCYKLIYKIILGGELNLISPRVIAACNHQIADQLVDLFKNADLKAVDRNLK